MITYFNRSLKDLSDGEMKMKNATNTLIAVVRESVREASKQLAEVKVHFSSLNALETFKFATTNVTSLQNKHGIAEKKLNNSTELGERALAIIMTVNASCASCARNDVSVQEAYSSMRRTVEEAKGLNSETKSALEKVTNALSGLNLQNETTTKALQGGSQYLGHVVRDFNDIVNSTYAARKTVDDIGIHLPGEYVTSDMTADKAAEVIERLARSRLANGTEELSLHLQRCEKEVIGLKSLIAQVDSNCSGAQEIAAEVDRTVDEAEEQSKEIQQIAVQTVVSELKGRWDALCALLADLQVLTLELESLKGRDSKVVRTISELRGTVDTYAVAASKTEMKCEGIAAAVRKAVVFRPDAAHEAKMSLGAYGRCATSSESVRRESSKALVAAHSTEELHVKVHDLQKTTEEQRATKHKELVEAKAALVSLLIGAFGAHSPPEPDACETFNFSKHAMSFANAQGVSEKLRNISVAGLAEVEQNVKALDLLVTQEEDGVAEVNRSAVVSEAGATNAAEAAEETEQQARKALKEVLEKQRSELCDVVTKLVEINRNTSSLMQQARSEEENAIAERLRAERSSEAAHEAADVSASASVYVSEAVRKHKETGEAVRATRKATRSLVRSGKAALSMNEKRIKTINDALVSAYHNVTKEENRAPLIPATQKVSSVSLVASLRR
ncbi:hypothetical protein ERJ75_000168100 [Trypanosoma vivax]|nr:hypothetical protein ERJ75_000168100 [Trypanosoma vivax]